MVEAIKEFKSTTVAGKSTVVRLSALKAKIDIPKRRTSNAHILTDSSCGFTNDFLNVGMYARAFATVNVRTALKGLFVIHQKRMARSAKIKHAQSESVIFFFTPLKCEDDDRRVRNSAGKDHESAGPPPPANCAAKMVPSTMT